MNYNINIDYFRQLIIQQFFNVLCVVIIVCVISSAGRDKAQLCKYDNINILLRFIYCVYTLYFKTRDLGFKALPKHMTNFFLARKSLLKVLA
jgi:hypothetical protein